MVVACLAYLLIHIAFGGHELGQDQAWLLYAAEKMVHGTQLYGPGLTESNPPLIIWLSVLPLGMAKVFSLSVPAAFYLAVLSVLLCSAGWCYRLLGAAAQPLSRGKRMLLTLCILAAESWLDLGSLGQREHLLVLLLLPYLVGFGIARRGELSELSKSETVLLAIAAGVGVCIKPQHLLTLLAFQVALALKTRSWRRWRERSNLAFAVTCMVYAAYVAAVLVFAPLYLRGEAALLVDTYWAFGNFSIPRLIVMDHHFLLFLAAGALLYGLARRRGLATEFAGYVLLCSVAASIAFDLQHTGFAYQHIPQDLLALLAVFWLGSELVIDKLPVLVKVFEFSWSFAAAIVLGIGVIFYVHRKEPPKAQASPSTLADFYASLPAGTPVLGLSTNPQAGFPYVVEDNLIWASRAAHLWMLPAVEQNEWFRDGGPQPRKVLPTETVERIAAMQRVQVAEDMTRMRPKYVVVPRCAKEFDCEGINRDGFSILDWLLKEPAFAAAWSQYRYLRVLYVPSDGLVYDAYELR